jgi:hypothetical protein
MQTLDGKPPIEWLAVDMLFFDDGTIYGRVLERSMDEAKIDARVLLESSKDQAREYDIPTQWINKKVTNQMFQAIAVFKDAEIKGERTWLGPSN